MQCLVLVFTANNRTLCVAHRHGAFHNTKVDLREGNAVCSGWRHHTYAVMGGDSGWEYSNVLVNDVGYLFEFDSLV